MPLKARVDSVDDVPEELREYYVEKDGKFLIDVEPVGGYALEDVEGLKTALSRERKSSEDARGKLKQFDDLDPEAAREAMRKVQEFNDWDPDKQVEEKVKAREQQMRQRHEEETRKLQEDQQGLTAQLEKHLITSAATQAIAEKKGEVDLILPLIERNTRMRRTDDNRFIAEVIDGDGNVRVGDSAGNPMTIPQLVEEFANSDKFARAFDASGATGSGATGSGGGGNGQPTNGRVPRQIMASDQESINKYADKIATGEVVVVDD